MRVIFGQPHSFAVSNPKDLASGWRPRSAMQIPATMKRLVLSTPDEDMSKVVLSVEEALLLNM